MLSFVRRRLTYANVAMTVALVLAMSGGAFAAGKFLITSTKQISPKVLKSLQGKAGRAGVAGAQGPAGPAGAVGPQGPAGAPGAVGAKGEAGPEGKEGKAGKEGKVGVAGSPWAVGGTLPSGKTETGEWAFGKVTQAASLEIAVASFPIELPAPMTASTQAHYITPGKTPTEKGLEINVNEEEVPSTTCLGTAAEPTALPGNLCVYAAAIEGATIASNYFNAIIGKTGAILGVAAEAGASGQGTWAVTAE